jgi:hypothetical protein
LNSFTDGSLGYFRAISSGLTHCAVKRPERYLRFLLDGSIQRR